MEEKKTKCAHRLSLDNRQEGTVTGVRDIHSFNESEVLLEIGICYKATTDIIFHANKVTAKYKRLYEEGK